MTNAEKFKDIFGVSIYTVASICKGEYMACEFCKNDTCTAQWWNSECKESTTKNDSPKYCDRNICLKNEYNNVGCEDCEVTKSQESTTKNDLGVDTDKLIADCEKMSFDFELFGRPTKVLLLDAVKNIVKDLSSVTPQESKTGHWIEDDEQRHVEKTYHCSECGHGAWGEYEKTEYCGGCGAKMIEPQESEDV